MPETSAEGVVTKVRLLINLNRICAVLSVGAAILLYAGEKTLGIPGLATAPHHEPLIVHCLLTALLLFGVNARLSGEGGGSEWGVAIGFILGIFLLPLIALVDLLVAPLGLFRPNGVISPAVLLALPGIQCGWSFFAAVLNRNDNDQTAGNEEAADAVGRKGDEVVLAAESSLASPGLTLYAHLVEAVLYFLVYGAGITALLFLVPCFELIGSAALSQQFSGWSDFFAALGEALRSKSFLFLIVGAATFGLIGWGGVSAYFRERRDQRDHANFNRDLDAEELGLIRTATGRLSDYAESIRRRWIYNAVAIAIFLLSAGVLFGLVILLAGEDMTFGSVWLEEMRTRGLPWYLYMDGFGFGDFLTYCFLFLATFIPLIPAGAVWRPFGALAILDYRKDRENEEDPWAYYRGRIALDVRRGVLKPGSPFDPGELIHRDYMRFAGGWYMLTGLSAVLALVFLYLDRMDYDLLTEDYMEITDYWTTRVHRKDYADTERVEITCGVDDDDELDLEYRLVFTDGRALDLGKKGGVMTDFPERLGAWKRIDALLRRSGIPVRHARGETGEGRRSRFNEGECIAGLDDLAGPKLREKVMPLLREGRGAGRRPLRAADH